MNIKNIAITDPNEITILSSLIKNQPISRADLAKVNDFNKTSISAIINSLLEANLIYESGVGESTTTGGRKPILLEFNTKAAVAISLELGADYIHSTLSYLDGELIDYSFKNDVIINKDTIHEVLVNNIDQLIDKIPKTANGLIGIGIGVHGVVLNNKLTFSPFYDFKDYDIEVIISKEYNCPVYVENEANLAAIGEYTFSTDQDRIININIKSGIGAGVIQFGKLFRGTHGRFGEIGHTILFPNGKECPCGNKGCLERYASSNVLRKNISAKKEINSITTDEIIKLWNQNDRVTTSEVLTNIEYLSIGINNLISSFDPDEIIINSTLFNKKPELLNYLTGNLQGSLTNETTLSVSKLTNKATIFGGIAVVTSAYLNIENLKFIH